MLARDGTFPYRYGFESRRARPIRASMCITRVPAHDPTGSTARGGPPSSTIAGLVTRAFSAPVRTRHGSIRF